MSPSTPQNASSAPASSGNDDQRNPLGFADVRSAEQPVILTDVPSGIPLGFAPRGRAAVEPATSEPAFRTEISFRRDHAVSTAVRAEAFPGGTGGDGHPEIGHAESREFELDLDLDLAAQPDEALDEVWLDDSAGQAEKVPFYKREIGFGRKKESALPTVSAQSEAGQQVPFYKREITFGRKNEIVAEPEQPAAPEPSPLDDQTPFFKRELSFKRRRPAVAAVESAGADVDAEMPVESEAAAPTEAVFSLVPDPVAAVVDPLPATEEAVLEIEDASERDEFAADDATAEEPTDVPGDLEPLEVVGAEPVFAAVLDQPYAEEPVHVEMPDLPDAEEPVAVEVLDQQHAVLHADTEAVSAAEGPDATPADETDVSAAAPAPPAARSRSIRARRGGSTKPKRAKKPSSGKGRRVVGIKIGASQLAAAVVQESAGRHELLQLVRQPIEPGLVVDGEVRDATRLGEVLRAFVEEHDLPRTNVRIGLASNRIGVRTVEISGIDDAERFDNAVRFKAHEVLPVAFHESVLDYRIVEERPVETGETSKRVLLVVAPRDQVEPYLQACATAGLRLTGIDLEALGLLRTFVDAHPIGFRAGDDTATVVVALGHESTTLLVSGGGVCDFTRVFDWGGDTLQKAIAGELGVDLDEAATILRHLSLTGRGSDLDSLSDADRSRANEAIRSRLTPFARELVSSLQFYQTQPDSLGIGEIVITGGTAHLTGLAEALHQMIGVSVRFGDPLGRVVSHAEIPDSLHAQIGSTAVAIGLAIEDAPWRTVNLLPSGLQQQGRKRPNVLVIAAPAVAAVSIAALAFGFVSARSTVSDRQKALDAVRGQIDALPEPTRATIDPALQGDQVARAQSVAQVLGGRLAWEPFFRDLSRALPANVWLEHIVAEAPDPVATLPVALGAPAVIPNPATGVTIDGYTYTQGDVARLLARLNAIPSIKSVTLKSSRHANKGVEGSKTDVVSFSITADLNGGAQ